MKLYLLRPRLHLRSRKTAATLLLALPFLTAAFSSSGQLIQWSAAGNNATFGPTVWPATVLSPDITLVSPFTRGSSIATSGTAASPAYGGSGGWNSNGTDANGFVFSFTPDAGRMVSLSNITAYLRRSNSGPSGCKVQYSIDGGAYTDVTTMSSFSTSGTTGSLNTVQLGAISDLQDIQAGTVVKFRFLPQGSTGNFYFMNDGIRVNGALENTPLAIVLGDVTAANEGAVNRLNWNSLTEEQGDRFAIERSADGISFHQITTLKAKGVPGHYSYLDEQPLSGINFYRLYLLNNDGTRTYSRIVSAKVMATATAVTAYPNPVTNTLTVACNGTAITGTIVLADVAGKTIYSKAAAAVTQFDMSGLPAGVYMIRLENSNAVQTIRVTKQ